MVNAWERYILNSASKVAHDAGHLSEECNTDQLTLRIRKPSIPPGYRLCRHCAENIELTGETMPAGVEVEHELSESVPDSGQGSPDTSIAGAAATGAGSTEGPGEPNVKGEADSGVPDGTATGAVSAGGPGDGSDQPTEAAPAGIGSAGADMGEHRTGPGGPGADAGQTGSEASLVSSAPTLTGNLQGTPHAGELIAKHATPGEHEAWSVSNSSNVRHLDYNIAQATLLVRFANGWEYIYGGVPYDVAREVATSDSPGTSFDARIKRADFPFERVAKS